MMTRTRIVRVTLYNKAGQPLALPEITLAPAQTKSVNIRDWITPERLGIFSEGSVEVYFHGPGMGITGQLNVTDERHNQSFDVLLREDANFASSKLDGLWFSLDHQTTVEVFVANTRPYPITITPAVYINGTEVTGEPLTLDSHVAETIDVGRLLQKRGVRKGFASGGISLRHNGQPGAIAVAGIISNKERGFSSTMRFVDAAGQRSTNLHGANVLIGAANTPPGLPRDLYFTPRAVVRNTTDAARDVKGRIRNSTDKASGANEIDAVTLNPAQDRD
jgi:hypothetical protein